MLGFCFASPLPRNSSLASYFASKILAFNPPPPHQEFPMTFHGVGMDFLLELHILTTVTGATKTTKTNKYFRAGCILHKMDNLAPTTEVKFHCF